MAFDVNKWLTEDMGFTADEAKAMLPSFTPERISKLEAGHLRQADYSRAMNDLKKSQDDLTAANTRLNEEMAEWARVQAEGTGITKKMRDDLEAAQLKVTQLTQRVTRIATDAGLDPAKALDGIDQAPLKPPTSPAPDLTGYARTDDINRQLGSLANMALTLPAELYAIATEHQQLFNQPLDVRPITREIETRASTRNNQKSLDPRQIWEELHKVPDRRTEIAAAERKAAEDAAYERGVNDARSQQVVPGSHTVPGAHAPIFGQKGRESVLKRPQPGQTVNAAAAALRTGKYRKEGAGSST